MKYKSKESKKADGVIRYNHIVNDIVPVIEKDYRVMVFPHHIKIITGEFSSYDYYPKGQRIGSFSHSVCLGFKDMSIDDFKVKFL